MVSNSLLDGRTLARANDPATSKEAAKRVARSGSRADLFVATLGRMPDARSRGGTANEVAHLIIDVQRSMCWSRSPWKGAGDAERLGLVVRSPARRCGFTGGNAMAWFLTEAGERYVNESGGE